MLGTSRPPRCPARACTRCWAAAARSMCAHLVGAFHSRGDGRAHAPDACAGRVGGPHVRQHSPERAEGAGEICGTTAKVPPPQRCARRGARRRGRACRFGQEQLSARESALHDAAACAYSSRSSGITLWPSSSRSSSSTSAGSSPCRAQRRTHHASSHSTQHCHPTLSLSRSTTPPRSALLSAFCRHDARMRQ